MTAMWQESDSTAFSLAKSQAQKSFDEGGIPIGSTLVDKRGEIIGTGHNQRVQLADPTAHGEVSCLRNAGLRGNYADCTIFTTLAPCAMCTGAILLFKISRVVVGEATTYTGDLERLREAGVEVVLVDDAECIELMQRFIAENPETWNEDIGEGV
ncbi:nucleoside deaminase [Yaniella flava]|uniref:Nucleoside deaminase n=2 Tax=Yaniella flava TaxID=287930 RepID=A0ABN2TZM0_9MICC